LTITADRINATILSVWSLEFLWGLEVGAWSFCPIGPVQPAVRLSRLDLWVFSLECCDNRQTNIYFLENSVLLRQLVGSNFMDLKLPKLGEGADSGVVVNILVKEGDTIAKDQTVLELENEKAVASIPSTGAGVVTKIYVKSGDRITVGQRILSVESSGAPAAPAAPAAAAPKPAAKKAVAKAAPESVEDEGEPEAGEPEAEEVSNENVAASPSIRKVARELGINLGKIRGSESGGRIVIGDVRAYIQRLVKLAAKPAAPAASGAAPAKPVAEQIDFSQWGSIIKKPVTPLRKVIARRMLESSNSVARVTQFDDIDFTRVGELRKKFAPEYEKKGVKLTLTPFILKAVAGTLKQHPIFNSSLDEVANEIIIKEYIHLGIAVDTEQGLMVPVIRDVDKKSLLDLAKELEALAAKARDRKITAEEMKGGTFTISNQGAIGGGHFTPIVNLPEVAILGLGRGAMKPVVRDGKVEARLLTPVALSYDHRVVDGGNAARFTVDLVKAFEGFSEDLVKI
jgi:pyruvate dehydrogenase E2 component (dihydrolipoamide acetyltransferase)